MTNEHDANLALIARADALKAKRDGIIAQAEGRTGERFRNAIRMATDIWAAERKLRAQAYTTKRGME